MYPILFKIPIIELPIYSYGMMLGLSLVFGWYIVMYLGQKDGFPKETLANCFIWTAVSAILGARVLFVLTNFDYFTEGNWWDMINMRKGGLVAYGGFIGGFLGAWIYLATHGIRLLAWADLCVPGVGSGLGITRLGCFMYGCDYGKPIPDDAPGWIKAIGISFPNWEYRFPDIIEQFHKGIGCMTGTFRGSPAFLHHLNMNTVGAGDLASLPVYPTQLIEVANGWIIFGLTLLVRSKSKFRGQAFLFFTAYYGITRTLMELVRGDTQRGGIGIMSTSQIVGITTFLAAVTAWIILSRKAAANPTAAMSLGPGADASKSSEDKQDNH